MSEPPAEAPDLIDVHVGGAIRARRLAIGVSQLGSFVPPLAFGFASARPWP
jgi:hypothetical protein